MARTKKANNDKVKTALMVLTTRLPEILALVDDNTDWDSLGDEVQDLVTTVIDGTQNVKMVVPSFTVSRADLQILIREMVKQCGDVSDDGEKAVLTALRAAKEKV